ncbi:hypothetical protein SERLA73DRAFT_70627 [Serpula lacrymans var. lacrymans S7.3]|uniref:Uncharacterized protein n=2 Tax=Serpula lacrymans var. lacrymans TaxID=341189 RepID=F8PPS4_SERL3|nr:uncharacterized protein SERLADRAFT_434845 [Serpula lacrymans var. lacrymans S7.9]EGO01441.1 hypothetical protein SERLA73DRAFT_70627 [Serpula lacrymans var. lacrymans S7.3]EGO27071.1 hypothetical protein SERLADRAFT_434845 [Serpula lacrymans var. lacrymans S7.9]
MSYRNNSTQRSQFSPNMPGRTTLPVNSASRSDRQDDGSAANNEDISNNTVHRCARCYIVCNSADELSVHSLACGVAAILTGMFTPFEYPGSSGPPALFENTTSSQVVDQTSICASGLEPRLRSQHERAREPQPHKPLDAASSPELARYSDGGSTKPRGFTGRSSNAHDVFHPEPVGHSAHVRGTPAADPGNLTDHQPRRSGWYAKPPKDYRQ